MLLTAQVNFPHLSIARILLSAAVLMGSPVSMAAELDLPTLLNTDSLDRILSEEITDDYIYRPPGAATPIIDNNADLPENAVAGSNGTATGKKSAADSEIALKPGNIDDESAQSKAISQTTTYEINTASGASSANQSVETTEQSVTEQSGTLPLTPLLSVTSDPSESVWQRISDSDRLPLKEHERVEFYTDQYLRESLWISKILRRGSPFLAHLVATLDKRFMPVELALLPAIESGYLPTAKSAGSAVGLWQIVPITAQEIGIKRDAWFDGRGDVLASTTAAIDYLSYLNAEFNGDWELTLAAYNAGPGRVRAAIKKNAAANLPTDYWSLDLPRETLNYVPKLIALVGLIKQKDHGGFDMPDVRMEPAFESIDVGFRVSIDKAARLADIDEDVLRALNAGLVHGVTAPEGPHYLLIPTGTGEQFQQAFANVDQTTLFSEPLTHDVVSGDTISSIALQYGITQRRLLAMNGLDNSKIRIGQKLAVIDARNVPDSVVEYVVSIGDTLSEIAHNFSVNVKDIRLSNGQTLDDDVIHPGDTLNIIIPPPASG